MIWFLLKVAASIYVLLLVLTIYLNYRLEKEGRR
jgi:hypothetical protein